MSNDTQTMTLAEFLTARIAEDEAVARDAAGWDRSGRERATGEWSRVGISSIEGDRQQSVIYSDNNQLSSEVADHIARHDPARVLAECEAKRRIVEEHTGSYGICSRCMQEEVGDWVEMEPPCPTLRFVALPYADHPDYREEWKP